MLYCSDCGAFVRQWTDKDGVIHYQCQGCNSTGEEMLTHTKLVKRDGVFIRKLECPKCKVWGEIDNDMYKGKVSMVCACGWHETIDLSREEKLHTGLIDT